MAKPDPEELVRLVEAFPGPSVEADGSDRGEATEATEATEVGRVDELLDGAYGALTRRWYPELRRRAAAHADGDCLRERVLEHVEAVPSFRLSDGPTALTERREALAEAAALTDEVREIAEWYGTLRSRLEGDRASLTRGERLLHDFGYALAHVLFLGASSPRAVVRRLRLAYRSVGVRIDETASEGGIEETTFTCPYRNVAAGTCGKRWVCHEKLDRVDDGYVSYLAERGISYQRPRGCADSEQCQSTVARDGPARWWPKTPPAAVGADS
ncbi:hypothetical protein DVK05_08315 [Halorubrum sp. Atlit-8R]|uniref:hypothetical protein n=1 Tax=unclassified Halorubrum TaxID=2642239 RepID=UPI000EF206FE|nr:MULTISPECIES: hypothetical protein [unclassified Halorubrum]RLM63138.1 hypothetical protein DVK08_17245 [Halorubrum sp. Atlit-9R]RLM82048.1 hypothetical protein DVK05_08315 [Halorubrum sp. Atlit-8R]